MMLRIKDRFQRLSATERLCLILGAALAVSLIPLIILSFYSHPAGDDYVYGASAHLAWAESHSLIETIKAALRPPQVPGIPPAFSYLSYHKGHPA